jgi:inosine/xanthosine triphosphatase
LLIIVGSENRVKIGAVQKAFQSFNLDAEVIGVEVKTSITEQPIGSNETVKGALERASGALIKKPDADLGVGVEAGLIKWYSRYLDQPVAVIVDRGGGMTFGAGPAFELPPRILSTVLGDDLELDVAFEKMMGIKKIGKSMGVIGFVSSGKVVREDLAAAAVQMALVPRLNPHEYGVRGLVSGKGK